MAISIPLPPLLTYPMHHKYFSLTISWVCVFCLFCFVVRQKVSILEQCVFFILCQRHTAPPAHEWKYRQFHIVFGKAVFCNRQALHSVLSKPTLLFNSFLPRL